MFLVQTLVQTKVQKKVQTFAPIKVQILAQSFAPINVQSLVQKKVQRMVQTSDEKINAHHEAGHAVSTLGRRRNRPKVENYVAARIRERRTELKMKQSALAEKMGVSASLVSQWEQAKTRVLTDDLERLAEALGTSRAYLVGGPSGVWQYATTRVTDKQQEDDELVGAAEYDGVPGGEKRYIFAKRAVPLTELRDMQEQLVIDGFRDLSDVQRVLVIKLIQELNGQE